MPRCASSVSASCPAPAPSAPSRGRAPPSPTVSFSGSASECDVRGFKLSRAGTSTYWDRLDYVMLASTRPATFEVDLADLAEWFAQARMALLGHSTSRHNHQYHSNSFGAPRDHRIPCGQQYGLGTRCRHRREVVGCPASRL